MSKHPANPHMSFRPIAPSISRAALLASVPAHPVQGGEDRADDRSDMSTQSFRLSFPSSQPTGNGLRGTLRWVVSMTGRLPEADFGTTSSESA